MLFSAPDIAIDLGTSTTSIYVRGRGIVISEQTVVVVNAADQHEVHAIGDEAGYILSRNNANMRIIRPIQDGMLVDFDSTEIMIRYFLRKAVGVSHFSRPRALVSIPAGTPAVARKAVKEAVEVAGARKAILAEKPFVAAIGSGLPVYDPVGSMVVDIGAGTADTAVLSMGGIVVSQSVPVGGRKMDEGIVSYLKKNSGMLIGDRTAEQLKIDLASAVPVAENNRVTVRGRDLLSSHAMAVEFSAAQAYEAVREPCFAILASIRWVLERTPPELSADIMRTGIHLTGGGARLFGLDQFIGQQLGIPVLLAKDPEDCSMTGLGFLVENPTLMDELAANSINS